MRLLAWNLNHRAARRPIPAWVCEAIAAQSPDVAVLTEYVEGPDHDRFRRSLIEAGLPSISVSSRTGRSNQVMIASRAPHLAGSFSDLPLPCALWPNMRHVVIGPVHVIGFRMLAYARSDALNKRLAWEWMIRESAALVDRPAIIVGDFNTAPGDPDRDCGDCLESMSSRRGRWRRAVPGPGDHSFRSRTGRTRLIDHLFASPAINVHSVVYSWDYERLAPRGPRRVGHPDHAMLIAELS